MQLVERELSAFDTGSSETQEVTVALACYFDVLATLETLRSEFRLFECAFLAVMASRFAYDDDRIVPSMRADIEHATTA